MKKNVLPLVILASSALMGSARADDPINLFLSVSHIKPAVEVTTVGIATTPGVLGQSEAYRRHSVPVETVNGNSKTITSVMVESGFKVDILPRAVEGGAYVADLAYQVKEEGKITAEGTRSVRLEHGKSVDVPLNGVEKLVVGLQ